MSERPTVTQWCSPSFYFLFFAFLFLWWFRKVQVITAQRLRVYSSAASWDKCPLHSAGFHLNKQLRVVHLYTCLNMDLGQVNKQVALHSNLLSERGNTLCHLHGWVHVYMSSSEQAGVEDGDRESTRVSPQEGSDSYLWGVAASVTRLLVRGDTARLWRMYQGRYALSKCLCSQIKGEGSSLLNAGCFQSWMSVGLWSQRSRSLLLRLNFCRSRTNLLI